VLPGLHDEVAGAAVGAQKRQPPHAGAVPPHLEATPPSSKVLEGLKSKRAGSQNCCRTCHC